MDKREPLKILGVCLSVALCPLALVVVGGFPVRQGVVLGLSLGLLAFGMASKPVARFTPYWIRVSPHWYQILTDFKLIGSLEEWRSILESVASSTGYRALRDGVRFTVVQQFENCNQPLIFWNQHQLFTSEFSFSEVMTPIQFERATHPADCHLPACFFMKPWAPIGPVAAYSFGIEVRDWWWEKVKDSCAAPLAVETNPLTGSVYLTFATLPLSEFAVYRDAADRWTTLRIRKQRDEQREQLGWKDITLHDPELGSGPTCIEHGYLSVEHRDI
jgi:hypothetical protein